MPVGPIYSVNQPGAANNTSGAPQDIPNTTIVGKDDRAHQHIYNNSTGNMEILRTVTTFKTVSGAASNTTIWTPATGKKFRLMGGVITIPSNAAISGGGVVVTVSLFDGGNGIGIAWDIFVPTSAVTTTTGDTIISFTLPGNGYLSSAINNALILNASATLTTSAIRASAWGCEE